MESVVFGTAVNMKGRIQSFKGACACCMGVLDGEMQESPLLLTIYSVWCQESAPEEVKGPHPAS
eukprot:2919468-Heterocapsa_arctica.AAC.1